MALCHRSQIHLSAQQNLRKDTEIIQAKKEHILVSLDSETARQNTWGGYKLGAGEELLSHSFAAEANGLLNYRVLLKTNIHSLAHRNIK